jgi:polyferredoxin
MDKIKKPRGLIRFASKNEIVSNLKKKITPRAIGYTVFLFLILALFSTLFISRSDVEVTLLRMPGLLSQDQGNNRISNIYDIRFINKTFDPMTVSIRLKNIEGEIKLIGHDLHVAPQEIAEGKIMVILDEDKIKNINTPIELEISAGGKVIETVKTSFLGNIRKRRKNK